jgi:hypothetical protein
MGWIAFGELLAFTAFLLIGLAWVWVNGDLDWVKKLVDVDSPAPKTPARVAAPDSRKAA